MPTYYWTGIDTYGTKKTGISHATTIDQLKQNLLAQNIALLTCNPAQKKSPIFSLFTFLAEKKITDHLLITFFQHLAILVSNGVDIAHALNLFAKQTSHNAFKNTVTQLATDIKNGDSFSTTLKCFPHIFNPFMIHIIDAGEKTGNLGICLQKIEKHLEDRLTLKKDLMRAALLPGITLLFAIFIILGLFIFIVPQFSTIFNTFERPLPYSTQIVFAISNALQTKTSIFLILTTPFIIFALSLLTRLKPITQIIDRLLLALPYINNILLLSDRITFLQTTSLFLHAGIPLSSAIENANLTIANQSFQQKNSILLNAVTHGQTLEQALKQVGAKYYPENLIALVATGEHSGKLDIMLDKAAQIFMVQLKSKLHFLTTTLQPILLIITGLIIAGLMLSIYLPIFDLANNFNQ
ncbi:MAG: type II secretion system F family protein [bacterium]